MPVSPVSVSSKPGHDGCSARILVVSLSWLGDCVMAMPALAALRLHLPGSHIEMLAKPSVAPLWALFKGVDGVVPLRKGIAGMRDTVREVRKAHYDFAYVLPKSFRSAWIPFLAGISGRRGMPGHGRDWMLSETAAISEAAREGHQSLEIADVLHVPHEELAPPPYLTIPDEEKAKALRRMTAVFGREGTDALPETVAFFPGAAYGPSKRWPADRFAAVGRKLAREKGWRILVLGSPGDRTVCEEVSRDIGSAAVNWAGETGLPELAGLLGLCRAVLSNDSGGMHLAAGLGVRVIGIFGLTDPVKTAPVGLRSTVLAAGLGRRSRDITRDSAEARAAMESIPADTVYQAMTDDKIGH